MTLGLPLVIRSDDHDCCIAVGRERNGTIKLVRVFWCANADAQRAEACSRAHARDETHGLTTRHGNAVQLLFAAETEILAPARQETLGVVDNHFALHTQ